MPPNKTVLFIYIYIKKSISSGGNFHRVLQFEVFACSDFQVTLWSARIYSDAESSRIIIRNQ